LLNNQGAPGTHDGFGITTRLRRLVLENADGGRFGKNRLSAASPGPSPSALDDEAIVDAGSWDQPTTASLTGNKIW